MSGKWRSTTPIFNPNEITSPTGLLRPRDYFVRIAGDYLNVHDLTDESTIYNAAHMTFQRSAQPNARKAFGNQRVVRRLTDQFGPPPL